MHVSKMLRALLLLLFLIGISAVLAAKDVAVRSSCAFPATRTRGELESYAKSWVTCEYKGVPLNRSAIIDYFKLGFDLDGDGKLSMKECETARNCFFTKAELQFGETCKTVFDRCDCNQDGVITRTDFERSYFTCLKDCDAGRNIYWLIGSRLVNNTAYTKCQAK